MITIEPITPREALALVDARFPGLATLVEIRSSDGALRGAELRLGAKQLVIVGDTISKVIVELFCDGYAYGQRKQILRRMRRVSRGDLDAQATYDANWGTYNGGLVDPMKTEQ